MRNTYAFPLSALIAFAFCAPRGLEAQATAAENLQELLKNVEQVRGQPTCDRTCLKDVMTKYLDSLVAHDPKKAPLAANVRVTEDAKVLPVGDGFWKTATKLRPFRTDFL